MMNSKRDLIDTLIDDGVLDPAIREAQQEIESLRQTCVDQDKRWWDKHMEDEREIESLRSKVELWRKNYKEQAMQRVTECAERDEWKRRAEMMWMWMHQTWVENLEFSKVSDDYRSHSPEAAEWFEEK